MPARQQFTARTLLIFVTLICVASFFITRAGSMIRQVAFLVLVINALGFLAGQVVTHIFGLPRDGSYSFEDDREQNTNNE